MGLEIDGSGFGLGTRSQRYAAIIEDGVVTDLVVETRARARRQLGRLGARQALTVVRSARWCAGIGSTSGVPGQRVVDDLAVQAEHRAPPSRR